MLLHHIDAIREYDAGEISVKGSGFPGFDYSQNPHAGDYLSVMDFNSDCSAKPLILMLPCHRFTPDLVRALIVGVPLGVWAIATHQSADSKYQIILGDYGSPFCQRNSDSETSRLFYPMTRFSVICSASFKRSNTIGASFVTRL